MNTDYKKSALKSKAPQDKPKQLIPPLELHACMGLNACKGHDFFGTNDCAGMGHCATQHHVCHTLNNCRGQGGCGLFGSADEFCHPGENPCAFQGSCGTPIPSSRFVSQGPNKGRSVWLIARELFEARMSKAQRSVGPAPMKGGPTLEWLTKNVGQGSSCGNAGAKYCSFVPGEAGKAAREARLAQFVTSSELSSDDTMENCVECEKKDGPDL